MSKLKFWKWMYTRANDILSQKYALSMIGFFAFFIVAFVTMTMVDLLGALFFIPCVLCLIYNYYVYMGYDK